MGVSLVQVLVCSSGVAAFRSSQRSASQIISEIQSHRDGSGETGHPANSNCFIGSGHSVSNGCGHAPAIESVYPCQSDDDYTSTCIKEVNLDFPSTGYNRFTKSTADWNQLTQVVVDAEFAGYGASVSVGVDYLKSSKSSESSIGFFCGSSLRSRSRYVQNPQGLKWSTGAKWLLGFSPDFFAKQHGLEYVYKIDYGGSFLGSFTINTRTDEQQDSLEVFADIAVQKPSFNAELAGKFNAAKSAVSSNITLYASAKWSGSTGIKQDYSDPGTVGKMFDEWESGVRSAPVPLAVYTRQWTDSPDFSQVLQNLAMAGESAKLFQAMQLFNTSKATAEFRSLLGQESAKLTFVSETIDRAITLTPEGNKARKTCFHLTKKKVVRAIIRIQQLDDISATQEEHDYNAGESDIIQSLLLMDEVAQCRTVTG